MPCTKYDSAGRAWLPLLSAKPSNLVICLIGLCLIAINGSVACAQTSSASTDTASDRSADTASGESAEEKKKREAEILLQAKKADQLRVRHGTPWVHGNHPEIEIWSLHGKDCKVVFDEPVSDNPDAKILFAIARTGLQAELNGDLVARAKIMDDSFTITRLRPGAEPKVISGKEAALAEMKEESERIASHPPQSIEFFSPMAELFGTQGVLTYKCRVVGSGENPRHSKGYITNVFVKKEDGWKQTHRRASWTVEDVTKAGSVPKAESQ